MTLYSGNFEPFSKLYKYVLFINFYLKMISGVKNVSNFSHVKILLLMVKLFEIK